jgi:hypothetical protein
MHFIRDGGGRQRVIAILSGIHCPGATVFRIPGERKFYECPAFSAVKISSDMIAGAHDVIDSGFLNVNFLATPVQSASAVDNTFHRAAASHTRCRISGEEKDCRERSLQPCS